MKKSHYDVYTERFIELLIKQRDYGLTEAESLEIKEKCQKTIDKINFNLKK